MKKKLYFILILLLGFTTACDKDEFADLNSDPSAIVKPNIKFLLTQALYELDDNAYTEWFYDFAKYQLPWAHATVGSTGNTSTVVEDAEHGYRWGALYNELLPNTFDIRNIIDNELTGKEQVAYQRIKAITYPIQVLHAIKVTDMYGYLPYIEAMKAKYTNPPLLTPKFDSQEELFNVWIEELNTAIDLLIKDQKYEGVVVSQNSPGNQDFVYNGDFSKWAKFANSLKLRIAVRLLHKNKNKALQIASEASANPAGLITNNDDNFYWCAGPQYYHFQNDIWFGVGSRNLIDFLRDNQDPRVRFMFEKNEFSSEIIKAFYNHKIKVPSYIEKYVDYHIDGTSGKKVFDGWKAPGEPWVRYFGAPASPDSAVVDKIYQEYFKSTNFKVNDKSFAPLSFYNEKNVVSNINYTYPDSAKDVNVRYDADAPYHSLLFSAGEVNFYLAEFRLLGASISGSASDYFTAGIRQSVLSLNKLAGDNGILYYSTTYDPNEKVVALQSNEIDDLLAKPNYQLTGDLASDLEKVYIQQYIHFLSLPNELYVTARRTGIPKVGSTILPRESFTDNGTTLTIPRRFTVTVPTLDDINYDNIVKAYKDQGFNAGSSDPQELHDQRLWYDVGAPDWGLGPNY